MAASDHEALATITEPEIQDQLRAQLYGGKAMTHQDKIEKMLEDGGKA